MDVLDKVEEEAVDEFENPAGAGFYRSLFRTPLVPRGHGQDSVWLYGY